MAQLFTNNAEGTLAVSVSNSDGNLTLSSGQGALFPNPTGGNFFKATLTQAGVETSWEVISCLVRSGDTLVSVGRGQEGTVAANWPAGSKLELRLTAGVLWPLAASVSGVLPGANVELTAGRVAFGSAGNTSTSSGLLRWEDANRTLKLGAGTGPSRLRTENAVSGAGASSFTIQSGDALTDSIGAGLMTVQGGGGGGAAMAGNVVVSGGDHPGAGTAGWVTISGGNSSGGANGGVVIETQTIPRVTVAGNGAVTLNQPLTLQAALTGTSANFSSTLVATSGTFSGALQGTTLRVTGSTAPDNGVFLDAAGVVGLSANNVEAYKYGSNAFLSQTDNSRDLGEASTGRWRNLYIVNSPTVGSDLRGKVDVRNCDLGLEFVLALRPIAYRLAEGRVDVTSEIVRWEEIGGEHLPVRKTTETPVPGERVHRGFGAQDVRGVLDKFGLDGQTFAGWCLADRADPDSRQALRYEQFIAPIVKALQELNAKVLYLEAQLKELNP